MTIKNVAVAFLVVLALGLTSLASGAPVYFEGEGYLTPTEQSQVPFVPKNVNASSVKMAAGAEAFTATGNTIVVNALANQFPDILLYVTIKDSNDQIITGLQADQLTITEQSSNEPSPTLETITSFTEMDATNSGISIALVFDVSGSMQGQQLIDAKLSAINFINTCNANDRIALVKFSSYTNVQIVQPSDWVHSDADGDGVFDIIEAINSLSSTGATALYDGTAKGIEAISQEAQPKAVIVFTDGENNDDHLYNINTVTTQAQNNGVPLYTIGLGLDDRQNLRDMASATGGKYYYAPTALDMAAIYTTIGQGIQGRYVIGYTTHNPSFDGTIRTVTTTYESVSGNAIYVVNSKPAVTLSPETEVLSNESQQPNTQLTISGTVTDMDAQNQGQNLITSLFYRHVGSATFSKVVLNLTSQGNGNYAFSGLIPSTAVLEPGVQYYIYASDGIQETYSPFNWNILPHTISVLENHAPVISHTPTLRGQLNKQIFISAKVSDPDSGDGINKVNLYYRIHNASQSTPYLVANMTTANGIDFSGSISPEKVTGAGVDYFISAWDNRGVRKDTESYFVNTINYPAVIQVAAANEHSLAVKSDGTVWAWGTNSSGQLGNGTLTRSITPVQVTGLTGVVTVAAGRFHSLAVKNDGTVWAWGYNGYGQLGDGTTTQRNTPVQVTGLTGVISVVAGVYHSLAMKSDGTVWAWGRNSDGQLGDGTTTQGSTPVQVTGLSGAVSVAAGDYHSLAVRSDGTVWAWGRNSSGQLGNGTKTQCSTPVQVTGLTGVVSVAAGSSHSLVVKSDGTVWAWGSNGDGQLGDGTYKGDSATTTARSTPVQVTGLTSVVSATAGGDHSLAVKSDGTVWAWGDNSYGQLGDGTTTSLATPIQVAELIGIVSVAAGGSGLNGGGHSLAVKGDGTVWAWGRNDCGQLGDGTTIQRSTPVQVTGLTGVVSVAAGSSHSLAVKSDGTVWAWGDNSFSQLGDGTTTDCRNPVQVTGLTGVLFVVAAGGNHSLAVKSNGTVWAWGRNSDGQLGDGTTIQRSTPVQVTGLTGVVSVAAGDYHSLAVKSDGTVWAWGRNSGGELGNGTTTQCSTPVQVTGLTGAVSVAAGSSHSLVAKSDGTVWAWGRNSSGQLGDGTTTQRSTPVQVTGLTGAVSVAAGDYHSLAEESDGTVWAWGQNNNGQLGDGTTTARTTPVQVTGLTSVVSATAGGDHSLAVKSNGTIWAWGYNNNGQLGDSTTTSRSTPVQVTELTSVVGVAAGMFHSLAVKSDGMVWAWGRNSDGQLGDGTTTRRSTPAQVAGLTGVSSGIVAKPNFLPEPGTYSTAQNVIIGCVTSVSVIHYTTDESEPTTDSPVYDVNAPIPVLATTTIKAKAFKVGWTDSETATGLYTITAVKGDVSGDSNVTLIDVILALQVQTGRQPTPLNVAADLNGDGKIGMAEAIYALQKVAEN